MAHEILSVKLCELDELIGKLHGRVSLSETADRNLLHSEIQMFTQECRENERALAQKLRYSHAGIVAVLSGTYGRIEQILRETQDTLHTSFGRAPDGDLPAEEKILLAEYALDFAVQAANRALLISMEAIESQSDAQLNTQEGCLS